LFSASPSSTQFIEIEIVNEQNASTKKHARITSHDPIVAQTRTALLIATIQWGNAPKVTQVTSNTIFHFALRPNLQFRDLILFILFIIVFEH